MANDLVSAADLTDYPGAPFTEGVVDAAVKALQGRLGWHVAPEVTETVTLDHDGGKVLLLPSRRVTAVSEVRDVSGSTASTITDYRLAQAGYLLAAGSFPRGASTVEVDLTHGYAATPADIFPAVAALAAQLGADQNVQRVQIDDFATSYRSDIWRGGVLAEVVASYGLPREF